MLAKLSDFLLRRHRGVLAFIIALLLAAGAAGSTLFDQLKGGGFDDPGADSAVAESVLRDQFGHGQPNLVLLVDTSAGVDEPEAVRAGTALSERLGAQAGVDEVTSYWTSGAPQLRSSDGDKALIMALIMAVIAGDDNLVDDRLSSLAPHFEGDRDGLDVRIGGYAMLQQEMNEQSERDALFGELIAFPITLIALVFVFGSFLTALLPLAVAIVTVLLTVAVMWLVAGVTDLSIFAVNAVTLLGLGLAIDYSLLIVSRYREELRGGQPLADALRTTLRTAGRTVIYSAITVAVAISGMLWFPLMTLRSLGYAGIATALLAAACALVVLPVLLIMLGRRVEPARQRKSGSDRSVASEDGFWHRLAVFVMRRPIPVVTIVAAFVLVLGLPALGLRVGYPDERVMPDNANSREVATTIRTDFDASEQNAVSVVVPRATDGLDEYAAELSELDNAARVDTATGSYAGGQQVAPAGPGHARFAADDGAYVSLVPSSDHPDELEQLVVDVRATPAPFDVLVGGSAAVGHDATAALVERLPLALAAVALAMFVLLSLLTGSVLLPLLSILLSALSLTAAYGALVWIFQDGNLSGLLGFTATGTLASTIPIMLFALAFGLAMDYQVFLLARIREEYERLGSSRAAVAMGLERVGRIVTAAAVLISIVFLGFLVSGVSFVKAFGIGLPLAVLVDATLIRGALLPATIRLLGASAWWAPGPLRRLHRRFGIREDVTAPTAPESVSV